MVIDRFQYQTDKTLVTTNQNIISHRQCQLEGLLLTLKLGDYEVAKNIAQ